MSASVGANASDVGLIVQGTLIFLSAVVGVLGFLVKSRLERREKHRENEIQYEQHVRRLRLERIRTQLREFLGPASMHAMGMWQAFWQFVVFDQVHSLNKLSGGAVNKHLADIDVRRLDLALQRCRALLWPQSSSAC